MTDVPVSFNDAMLFRKAMDRASILQIRARLLNYSSEVAAQHRMRANITIVANNDIPDQNSSGVDVSGRRHNRYQIFNSVTSHGLESLRGRLVSVSTDAQIISVYM
jgi:hypothetical protein